MDYSLAVVPPDDTGSRTFERFCYQAHIAFRFCFDCVFTSEIVAVIVEHVEDLAVQTDGGWRLIQVKTRDPELGPWRLSHALKPGGGIDSLWRSHQATVNLPCSLELFLEGHIASGDDLQSLSSLETPIPNDVKERIRRGVNCQPNEIDAFIQRLRVVANQPSRSTIMSVNIERLGRLLPDIRSQLLRDVYWDVLSVIQEKMTGHDTRYSYPASLLSSSPLPPLVHESIALKRLDRERLQPMFQPLTVPSGALLLRMSSQPDGRELTVMEEKLRRGGATESILKDATELRANASIRRYKTLAAGGSEDDLESVDIALRVCANSAVARNKSSELPAVLVWSDLLQILGQQAISIDPSKLFEQSPYFLLGEICELSDRCITDWGYAS